MVQDGPLQGDFFWLLLLAPFFSSPFALLARQAPVLCRLRRRPPRLGQARLPGQPAGQEAVGSAGDAPGQQDVRPHLWLAGPGPGCADGQGTVTLLLLFYYC